MFSENDFEWKNENLIIKNWCNFQVSSKKKKSQLQE